MINIFVKPFFSNLPPYTGRLTLITFKIIYNFTFNFDKPKERLDAGMQEMAQNQTQTNMVTNKLSRPRGRFISYFKGTLHPARTLKGLIKAITAYYLHKLVSDKGSNQEPYFLTASSILASCCLSSVFSCLSLASSSSKSSLWPETVLLSTFLSPVT